jgi:hypothetical protein
MSRSQHPPSSKRLHDKAGEGGGGGGGDDDETSFIPFDGPDNSNKRSQSIKQEVIAAGGATSAPAGEIPTTAAVHCLIHNDVPDRERSLQVREYSCRQREQACQRREQACQQREQTFETYRRESESSDSATKRELCRCMAKQVEMRFRLSQPLAQLLGVLRALSQPDWFVVKSISFCESMVRIHDRLVSVK